MPLVAPYELFEDRITRLDLRLAKVIGIPYRGGRLQVNMDLYNALNANAITLINSNYGAEWRKPNFILDGRMVVFGAKLDF